VLLLTSALMPLPAMAGLDWAGGPATTMQRFDFTTSATAVAPDAATNPLGIASALVEAVAPPGAGWQNPNAPFTTAGINGGDGAWDLGPNGHIEVAVPVSPTP